MVTGTKNQSVSNMEKKTLDILADAISDVGSLQWWHANDNMVQVEFRDIQLYDESKPEKDTPSEEPEEITYILNTNTKKFHQPYCSSVQDIKDKNKRETTQSREEIISQGYQPCKRCNP